jgi:hypothetical protein
MVTLILLNISEWILEYLEVYYPNSPLRHNFQERSKKAFQKISNADTDTIKSYSRYILLWLAFDYFAVAWFCEKYLHISIKIPLLFGALLFLIAVYFFISKSTFEITNEKMKTAAGKLLLPAIFFLVGAYLIPSMPINDPSHMHIPEAIRSAGQKLLFVVFFVLGCASTALLTISLSFTGFVSLNYYGSNVVCGGIRRFSTHCLGQKTEPHNVLKLWLAFPLFPAILEFLYLLLEKL